VLWASRIKDLCHGGFVGLHCRQFLSSELTMNLPLNLPDAQPALRVIPMPADINPAGDVFGGWVMAQIDMAGAVPAVRRARGRVATIAINGMQFNEPIAVGDRVSLYADIVKVGNSSITVDVQVYAERTPENPTIVKVTEARLTYVAMDKQGNKRQLPPG
jgi:acyl-CoA thioesterase YciA